MAQTLMFASFLKVSSLHNPGNAGFKTYPEKEKKTYKANTLRQIIPKNNGKIKSKFI